MNTRTIYRTVIFLTFAISLGYYFGVLLPQKNMNLAEQQKQAAGEALAQEQQGAEQIVKDMCKDDDTAFTLYEYAFEDYSVEDTAERSNAPLDLKSHPIGMKFQTAIAEDYEKGPNFAGHYTVSTWGCGTECQNSVIVNNWTGKILKDVVGPTRGGVEYRIDSRLLVANMDYHFGDRAGCEGDFIVDVERGYFEITKNGVALNKVSY